MKHVQDELLIAYIEGDVGEEERRRIEEHLSVCQMCRDNYVAYVSLIREVESMPVIQAPQELDARVRNRMNYHLPLMGVFAFSAMVVLVVSVLVGWFPRILGWILGRLDMSLIVDSTIRFFEFLVKIYTLTSSQFNPAVFAGVIVVLSIMMAIALRRRLEGYAGSIN